MRCVRLREQRVPDPLLQQTIELPEGGWYRADFLWLPQRVIGEADGMLKYDDPSALRREKRRQERLEDLGYVVVRWGWADLANPAELGRRVQRALHRAERLAAATRWEQSGR